MFSRLQLGTQGPGICCSTRGPDWGALVACALECACLASHLMHTTLLLSAAELSTWTRQGRGPPSGRHVDQLLDALERVQEERWPSEDPPVAQLEQQAQQQQEAATEQQQPAAATKQPTWTLGSMFQRSRRGLAIIAQDILSHPPGQGHLAAKNAELAGEQSGQQRDKTYQPEEARKGRGAKAAGATAAAHHMKTRQHGGSSAVAQLLQREQQLDSALEEAPPPPPGGSQLPPSARWWEPVGALQQATTAECRVQHQPASFASGELVLSGPLLSGELSLCIQMSGAGVLAFACNGSLFFPMEEQQPLPPRWCCTGPGGSSGTALQRRLFAARVSGQAKVLAVGGDASTGKLCSLAPLSSVPIRRSGLHGGEVRAGKALQPLLAAAEQHPATGSSPSEPAVAIRWLDGPPHRFALAFGEAEEVGQRLAAAASDELLQLAAPSAEQPEGTGQHSTPWVFSAAFPGGAAAACLLQRYPALFPASRGHVSFASAAGPLAAALREMEPGGVLGAVCIRESSSGAGTSSDSGGFGVAAAALATLNPRKPGFQQPAPLAAALEVHSAGLPEGELLLVLHEHSRTLLLFPTAAGTAAAIMQVITPHVAQLAVDAAAVFADSEVCAAAAAAEQHAGSVHAWNQVLVYNTSGLCIPGELMKC